MAVFAWQIGVSDKEKTQVAVPDCILVIMDALIERTSIPVTYGNVRKAITGVATGKESLDAYLYTTYEEVARKVESITSFLATRNGEWEVVYGQTAWWLLYDIAVHMVWQDVPMDWLWERGFMPNPDHFPPDTSDELL